MSTSTADPGILERVRILLVAGVPTGVLVAGVGSRVAMYALRVTSPDYVVGVTSDDGFEIGRFTVGGTYNLLLVGAAVGLIGAALYRLVAPLLIGPIWFQRLTVALASGAVVGSLLVHADGVDFTLLQPTWFAVALFVALPALFGATIGAAVDRVERGHGWESQGRWRIVAPVAAVVCFPVVLFPLAVVVLALVVRRVLRPLLPTAASPLATNLLRAVWLSIAVLGLVALVGDVGDLSRG